MKFSDFILLLFSSLFFNAGAAAQNVSLNVLTQNSGLVQIGKSIFFEVTINNTDASAIVGAYKLKIQVSVPDSIVAILKTGHNLPTGWNIISNEKAVINISNGKDLIAPYDSRTLLIAVEGRAIGGPVLMTGQLSFSNGASPGSDPGSLKGDNPADNYSTSSCKVIQ